MISFTSSEIVWKYAHMVLTLWSMVQCAFTFRNANQRSLRALISIRGTDSMCVSPPLAHSQIVVSYRESGRIWGTTTVDQLIPHFNSTNPSPLFCHLFFVSVRAWHKFYITAHGFHLPLPSAVPSLPLPSPFWLCPISHCRVVPFVIHVTLSSSGFSLHLSFPLFSLHP